MVQYETNVPRKLPRATQHFWDSLLAMTAARSRPDPPCPSAYPILSTYDHTLYLWPFSWTNVRPVVGLVIQQIWSSHLNISMCGVCHDKYHNKFNARACISVTGNERTTKHEPIIIICSLNALGPTLSGWVHSKWTLVGRYESPKCQSAYKCDWDWKNN